MAHGTVTVGAVQIAALCDVVGDFPVALGLAFPGSSGRRGSRTGGNILRRSAGPTGGSCGTGASRQARISAAKTSMPKSRPKPTRLTDPVATPAATAAAPSTAFQPMVSRFSSRPCARRKLGRTGTDGAEGNGGHGRGSRWAGHAGLSSTTRASSRRAPARRSSVSS
jgi:hypothetical protein